jgi:lipid-A-disaccharide synthase
MKYFLVAGEASGDMHGANLVGALAKVDQRAQFWAWGGDKMKAKGVKVFKHIQDLAFMGFKEVILNIRTILGNFTLIKKQIVEVQPDVLILVDYPGFNLRLARWAKEKGYRVVYYIAPQAWAWKANRVEKLKKYTDQLLCILPFEKKFFEDRGLPIEYVGHPLLEQIELSQTERKNTIALLPGSRAQEVKSMLPEMLNVIENFPDYEFKIARSPNLQSSFYNDFLSHERVSLHVSGMAALLNEAKVALVTSGTATLETALYNVPQVVCYKSGALSYEIAKRIIKVPYISLVNLILEKEAIKELIQSDLNEHLLIRELSNVLSNNRQTILKDYANIRHLLGEGNASHKAATLIYDRVKNL